MRLLPFRVLVLLLVLSGIPALGASEDEWLGPDKPKHFVVCTALAGAGYGGGALLFDAPAARWLTGAGLAMGIGLGKELYDSRPRGRGFSGKDLAWDAAGTVVGLGGAFLVDRFIFGRGKPSRTPPSRAVVLPITLVFPDGSKGLGPTPVSVSSRRRRLGGGVVRALGGQGLPGPGAALVLDGRDGGASRLAFDELHQLLPLVARVHHQHGATPTVAAGDEHGDLAPWTLIHAPGGQDADLLGQTALGERALQPARQVQPSASRASAHEALAADEHLHLFRRLHRSIAAVVPHPSSSASESFAPPLPRDAPLHAR